MTTRIGDTFVRMHRDCRRERCYELFAGTYRGDGMMAVHTWRCVASNDFLTLRSSERGFRLEDEWETGTCIKVTKSAVDARAAHDDMVARLDRELLRRLSSGA